MNLNLSNLPGAFGSGPVPDTDDRDVSKVRVDLLDPFPNHPYSVNDDQAMDELVESVRMLGVVAPLLLRPVDGRYQIISGHRRAHAARLAGWTTTPRPSPWSTATSHVPATHCPNRPRPCACAMTRSSTKAA